MLRIVAFTAAVIGALALPVAAAEHGHEGGARGARS
jgi:hypothetical protein